MEIKNKTTKVQILIGSQYIIMRKNAYLLNDFERVIFHVHRLITYSYS